MHRPPAPTGLEVVGIIPAAGQGSRLGRLPCSKEIYPVGFWHGDGEKTGQPKAVCHYLLDRMHLAGVHKVFIIVREGKWDIPAYLGDGYHLGLHLAYLMMRLPYGPPFTLDQAYPFVRDALVVTGFPDLLFQPEDAFVRLLQKQASSGAEPVRSRCATG
jgi:glucose-1-phosphate thymidylyltransferase